MPSNPSLVRGSAVTALCAIFLLQATAEAADCRPAKTPPSAEYLDVVTRYAKGDHAGAVRALGSDVPERLRCDLENLEAAAVAAKRCRGACEDRVVFERFPLRSAILLHAEREIFDQFPVPVSEQPVSCGVGPQAPVVERLIAMLALIEPESKGFLSRFYVAMARRAHWSHCLSEADQWARTGLKRFPKDATLLLTRGIILDTIGFLTLVPGPRTPTQTPQAVRQAEARFTRIRGHWEQTRVAFEAALEADPALYEARLRLGRVLWRLNRPDLAHESFKTVLEKSGEPIELYLAHLFLGRVYEDRDDYESAEKEYLAALALRPLSEPAAVAVAHARLRLGNSEGARVVLETSIEQYDKRTEVDPFKHYPMFHAREGQILLEALKTESIR